MHRRIFAAMVAHLDDGVGPVLEKLRQEGLEENTLLFFISDNGGPTREPTSSNQPLRGGKGDVYEGGIRIPFLIQWKGQLPAGKVYDHPVISLDVHAAAAASAPIPNNRPIDGVDLLPYLTGANPNRPHEALFWRMPGRTAFRLGDWKLLRSSRRGSGSEWQLYNLADDLSESHDLAPSRPEKLDELRQAWERLNAQMIPPSGPAATGAQSAYVKSPKSAKDLANRRKVRPRAAPNGSRLPCPRADCILAFRPMPFSWAAFELLPFGAQHHLWAPICHPRSGF